MGKMKEYGLLQNYLRRGAPKSPNCSGQNTKEERADAIRFEKVVLPFTIFAIGSIFAIIIMAFEKCCLNKKKSFEDHKNKEWKQDDSDVAYRRQRVCHVSSKVTETNKQSQRQKTTLKSRDR